MLTTSKQTPFSKYQANGNDFIIINHLLTPSKKINKNTISKLCNRHIGIGADGLFIVLKSKNYDYKIDYYNSDGSWETFCANGSRCVAKYMYDQKLQNNRFTFETAAGSHKVTIGKNNIVKMNMPIPKYKSNILKPAGIEGFFINSGAKHFVCEYNNLEKEELNDLGKTIRNDIIFRPYGINVNFYKLLDRANIRIVTYEKGVEKIMSSCSSGSAGVVFHLAQSKKIISPVTTISKGGSLCYTFNKDWTLFDCSGPAQLCFNGAVSI